MGKKKPAEITCALKVLSGLDKSHGDYKSLQKLLPLLAIKRGKAGLEVSEDILQDFAAQGTATIETAIAEMDEAAKEAAKPTYQTIVAKLRADLPPEPEEEAEDESGELTLLKATDLATIKKLVQAGADVNEKTPCSDRTPLYYAARQGDLEAARYLIEQGARVDYLATHIATAHGHLPIVRYFIEDQNQPLDADYLLGAAKGDHTDILAYLLKKFEEEGEEEKITITAPLVVAAGQGHIRTIKYLMKKAPGLDTGYALENAAQKCHWGTVKFMVENGARPSSRTLNLALADRKFAMAKYLVKNGANPNHYDPPLTKAIKLGHLPMVRFLVENGADITAQNNLPLKMAAQGHLPILKYLVKKGVDIHAEKDAALRVAAVNNHMRVVKYLVKQGTDVTTNKDLLAKVVYHSTPEMVAYLVKQGAPLNPYVNDAPIGWNINDLLNNAVNNYNYGVARYLVTQGADKSSLILWKQKELELYTLWQEKFPHNPGPKHTYRYNPYHFKEEAYNAALSMLKGEGYGKYAGEQYAYNLSALFQTEDRILQYLARWGDGQSKQPLHDIAQMINTPLEGRPNLVAWGDAVLKHGPKMAKLVKFSDKIPEPVQSTLNAGQDKDTSHKTWSYKKTYEKVAQFAYQRGGQNPELARLCFNFTLAEDTFNGALEAVKRYQEKYAANDNRKPGDRIPDIKINGKRFDKPGYRLYKLPDGDIRGLLLGEFTDCCQSIGSAGSKCAKHGFLSENAGFYVVEDKKKKQIVAQSWAWRGKKGGLVLDSIESLKGHFKKAQWQPLVETLADEFKKQTDITGFYIGKGGATPDLPYEAAKKPEKPLDYNGYRDSKNQYCVFKR